MPTTQNTAKNGTHILQPAAAAKIGQYFEYIQGSFAQQTSGPQTQSARVTKPWLICDVDTAAPDAMTARGLGAGLGSCDEVLCFHHFPNYSVTRVTRPVLYCTVLYCTVQCDPCHLVSLVPATFILVPRLGTRAGLDTSYLDTQLQQFCPFHMQLVYIFISRFWTRQ